ncbi:MAG: acyl-CoA thioesterase [Thermomicrobiales bacterium]
MNRYLVEPEGAETPRFETYVRVRNCDIDALGHTNNAAYVNFIEQAAVDHARFLGLSLERTRELGGVFVARQHSIQYVRPTFSDDLLRVVTWLGPVQGARVERAYRILRVTPIPDLIPVAGRSVPRGESEDGQELVCQASTEWVFVSEAGQPRRIPVDIAVRFDPASRTSALPR